MTSDEVLRIGDESVLIYAEHGPAIADERDAGDLIAAAWNCGAAWVAIPTARLAPEFFRLRTGVAGALLQKFVNYRLRVVIVGDLTDRVAERTAWRDFVLESNQGRTVWFVRDRAALLSRLLGEAAQGARDASGSDGRP
ncbi:DUF4180 domain-containing protein [Burkholderia alba]|uniref:DUF4180 domain-containing protein n=1 Tax=Burkholderia alba TaxID=2683677 RepID=UPI002B05BBCB|nr:DUF4180 domain-containing protein [Burkholderia alba]